jgi:hypothetical protein
MAAQDRAGAGLEGGGSVVFLEFAAPVDHTVAGQVAEQWRTAAGDAEFEEVRRAAQLIDAGYRKSTPWWGRCDLNEAHIRKAADGRLDPVGAGNGCGGA